MIAGQHSLALQCKRCINVAVAHVNTLNKDVANLPVHALHGQTCLFNMFLSVNMGAFSGLCIGSCHLRDYRCAYCT